MVSIPVFDYQCCLCLDKQIDVFVHSLDDPIECIKCHGEMVRLFPGNSRFYPKIFPADGIYLENVCAEGKTFYSEKEMKQYAKDNDLELGALL